MSNEPENTLDLLTATDIHPSKEDYPFVCLLHLDDLLTELNQLAHSYRFLSFNTHECQQQALRDFAQQIEADGRRFIPLPEVNDGDPTADYFQVMS